MEYFRCHSVFFLEMKNKDFILRVQKLLNAENRFYYSSSMTLSVFWKAALSGCHRGRSALVIVDDGYTFFKSDFSKMSNEVDISKYKWLVLSSTLRIDDFRFIKIPLSTEFMIAERNSIGEFNLTEIYDTGLGRKRYISLGQFFSESNETDKKGFNIYSQSLFHRRKNLDGQIIKVLSPLEDPCLKRSFDVGIASIVWCIHKQLWDVIAEMLNATTVTLVDHALSDESIQNSEAELTFRSALVNSVDMDTRSFLWPTFIIKSEIFTSYTGQSTDWLIYMRPFSSQLWFAVALWIIFCDIIMLVVQIVFKKNLKMSFMNYYSKYSLSCFFAFCNQGISTTPKSLSHRIIFLLIFLVPAFLFPGYSAILQSYLTVKIYKKPFQSLEELSRSRTYKLGFHNTLTKSHVFSENDNSQITRDLLKYVVLPENEMPATDAEAVERLCKKRFAYMSVVVTIAALKPKCKYYKLNYHFQLLTTSIEMKKNSVYEHFFNRCQRSIDFNGILERVGIATVLKFVNVIEKSDQENEENSPIVLSSSAFPFIILFLGMLLSIFLFFCEIIIFKRKNSQTNDLFFMRCNFLNSITH